MNTALMNCLSRQTTYSCSYKMKREQPYDLGDCSEGIPLPIYPLLSNTSTLFVLDLGRVVDRRVRCQAINKTNVCQELRATSGTIPRARAAVLETAANWEERTAQDHNRTILPTQTRQVFTQGTVRPQFRAKPCKKKGIQAATLF